ncbi:MAG TPA: glycosyltransferase [Thermoanaerobaculia bacterium]|nr:glycosyltransferase [Thermoanaerobaculia bacterium]
MNDPRVSVHVLTYQHRDFIRQALDSVLAQDYPNLEIVVGDDASTDGTAAIIAEYERAHPGVVKALLSDRNLGITANANRILEQCTGEFIAWFAGDDEWLPGKLSAQVAWFAKNPDAVLCYTNTEIFDSESGRPLRLQHDRMRNRFRGGGIEQMFRSATFFASSSVMTRRSAIPSHGFDARVRNVSDWLLWVDVASRGRIGYVRDVYTRYRLHSANIMKRFDAALAEQLVAIGIAESRYPQYVGAAKRIRADILFATGVERLRSGDTAGAARMFTYAVRARWMGSPYAPFPLNLVAVAAGRLGLLPLAWRMWIRVRSFLVRASFARR